MDLKKCINNVHTNQPFPGRREDYASQQVYDNWQKREVKQLTELMKSLMLMNPKLSIGAGSETDVGKSNLLSSNRSSTIGSPDGENVNQKKKKISSSSKIFFKMINNNIVIIIHFQFFFFLHIYLFVYLASRKCFYLYSK